MTSTAATGKKTEFDFRLCPKCNKTYTSAIDCPDCGALLKAIDYSFFLKKTFGKYLVKKLIGIGGMGMVFQAVHKTLNKKVAIKVFIPNISEPTYEKRFLKEARILAELKHPNIVEIYDFDISQWHTPYYVMECLEGKNLRDELKRYRSGMPLELAADYLRQMVLCLAYAHEKKVVHRDLKPENIIIENIRGVKIVKILDFGIAKTFLPSLETSNLTATAAVLGSPYYLTPEQIQNRNIGPHTDQYALALVAVEMLTGKMAREGKSVGDIFYKETHYPLRPASLDFKRIPKAVGHALVKATMPEPASRFPDISAFGRHLLDAMIPGSKATVKTVTENITTRRIVTVEDAVNMETRQKQRHRILGVALAAVIVIAVLLFVFVL